MKNCPDGTTTCPPPARLQAAMAAANAAVQSVVPSPTAPNRVIGKYRGGKCGRRTEATMRSAARSNADHGPDGWLGRLVAALTFAAPAHSGLVKAPAPASAEARSRARRLISFGIELPPGEWGYSGGCAGRQRGSGSGFRPARARNSKSQPLSAWVTCSLYSAP